MLRKFRNLDKIEILQNAVNCLTAENERLKQKNENLEIKLDQTDLAKVKIYDLRKEVENKEKKLTWLYNKYYTYVQNAVDTRLKSEKRIKALRAQRKHEQGLLVEETKRRREVESSAKRLQKSIVKRNKKMLMYKDLSDRYFSDCVKKNTEISSLNFEIMDLKEKIAKKDMQLEASRVEWVELNEGFWELKKLLHEQKEENKRLKRGSRK